MNSKYDFNEFELKKGIILEKTQKDFLFINYFCLNHNTIYFMQFVNLKIFQIVKILCKSFYSGMLKNKKSRKCMRLDKIITKRNFFFQITKHTKAV